METFKNAVIFFTMPLWFFPAILVSFGLIFINFFVRWDPFDSGDV